MSCLKSPHSPVWYLNDVMPVHPLNDVLSIDETAGGIVNSVKLVDSLDPKSKKPNFLMLLTGTNTAYRRDDGVWVVPLACLGP